MSFVSTAATTPLGLDDALADGDTDAVEVAWLTADEYALDDNAPHLAVKSH